MSLAYAWEIYCTTEQRFKLLYSASSVVPPAAVCPTNALHGVNPGSICREPDQDVGNATDVFTVAKTGNDAPLLGQPWLTLGAALDAVAALAPPRPVLVQVEPGTYAETAPLVPPASTEIRGLGEVLVTVPGGAATAAVTVAAPGVVLRDLRIALEDAGTVAYDLTGVLVTSDLGTCRLQGCTVSVAAPAAVSGVHAAVRVAAPGTAPAWDGNTFSCSSTSAGGRRGLLVEDGLVTLRGCRVSASGAGVATAGTGAVALTASAISGGAADLEPGAGGSSIDVDAATTLASMSTTGPFHARNATVWRFGEPGELWGADGWLRFGTEAAGTATATEYRATRPTIIVGLAVSCGSSTGGAATFTVYRRQGAGPAAATAVTCALATNALTAANTTDAVTFAAGDYLSIRYVKTTDTIIDVVATVTIF